MSVLDSRKSFLSKLALCALAAGTMPTLLLRRWIGGEPRATKASAAPTATAAFAPKPDLRAIPRESSLSL